MKALLENKLVLHIVGEAIVFIAVIFYFSQRNKRIMNHINDLVQRLEEQEDTIHKQEKAIEVLTKQFNDLKQLIQPVNKPEIKKTVNQTEKKPAFVEPPKMPNLSFMMPSVVVETLLSPSKQPEVVQEDSRVTELSTVEELGDDEEHEVTDEDLDKELENELKELEADSDIKNIN